MIDIDQIEHTGSWAVVVFSDGSKLDLRTLQLDALFAHLGEFL